jgi:hypothetical protein
MITLKVIIETIEQICKESNINNQVRPGPISVYSDSYFITLIILKSLFGFSSELSFLRFLTTNKLPGLTTIPERSWYNRKAKKLIDEIEEVRFALLEKLGCDDVKFCIVDSVPVPVISYARARRCKSFAQGKEVAYGYCAATKTHYYGKKLTLVTTQNGIPIDYHLSPANPHDVTIFKSILKENNHRGIHFIGDKGYLLKEEDKENLLYQNNCQITTPYRKNQSKKLTSKDKKLLQGRKIIETVNSQLDDQMNLKRTRAKSNTGLEARISGIILGMTFGIYFNQIFNRNILSLKSIVT